MPGLLRRRKFDSLTQEDLAAIGRACWPRDGVPGNSRPWLVSTGRFKALDALRRRARFGTLDEAADRALALTRQEPERRFLAGRLGELPD